MSRLSIVKVRQEHDVNGYLLTCSETKEALVIDPGQPIEKMIDQLKGLSVRWVIATHGHPGHIAGKDAVQEATGATTCMHMTDAKQFLRSAGRYVGDGDELEFGHFRIRVIHTPGHTPGSLSLLVGNHLFTGDTLLPGGIAKPKPETDIQRQMMSIGTKLLTFPPATAIYPGHGPATSLGAELQNNPIFQRR